MRTVRPLLLWASAVPVLLLTVGCHTPPQVLPLPTIEGEPAVFHYRGSALSGPQHPDDFVLVSDDTYTVQVDWAVHAENPRPGLPPLGTITRLHLDLSDPNGLRAAPLRIRRARGGALELTDRLTEEAFESRAGRSGTLRGLLAHGLTTRFRWTFRGLDRSPEVLELVVSCAGEPNESPRFLVALGLRDLGADGVEDADDRGELVLFEPTVPVDEQDFALYVPIPFRKLTAQGLYVQLGIRTPPRLGKTGYPSHLENLERCRLHLAASAEALRMHPELHGPQPSIGSLRMLLSAVQGTGDRDTFFSLARVTEAKIVQDVVLSAPDDVVTDLLRTSQERIAEVPSTETRILGWVLDRAAIEVLYTPERQRSLPPALRAVLIRHLGAVALRRDAVHELLARVKDPNDLHAHLVAENRELANDSSSLVSARATSWLRAHGVHVDERGGSR